MLSFIGGSPVTSSKEQQGLYSCNPSCVTTVSYKINDISGLWFVYRQHCTTG